MNYFKKYLLDFIKPRNSGLNQLIIHIKLRFNPVYLLDLIVIKINLTAISQLIFHVAKI